MVAKHSYFVFVEGLTAKAKSFDSRLEAEEYMHKVCQKAHVNVECTEADKHERKYSDHNGIRFYINRV